MKGLSALEALLYSYCPTLLALGVLVRECNWNGRSLNSSAAAKKCIGMSTILMMNIIPFEKWLSCEYLRTNTLALLLWSDWYMRAPVACFLRSTARQCLVTTDTECTWCHW